MLRFAHSEYLYALYLMPVIVILYWYSYRKQSKSLNEFANEKLHKVLFPLRSGFKSVLKFGMTLFATVLIIIGLANPQVVSKIEEVKQIGIDVFIALDVSLSMSAEDIKPSRLDKAKYEISKLIQKLRGDRIGLVIFSGEAYIQFPLTSDYSAANLLLSAIDINSVPQQGTAIGSAIQLAVNSFKEDEETKKAIIIITDGEDHEGELKSVIDDAISKGIAIYAIGFGSTTGTPIPVYNAAGVQVDYKKDNEGNIVLTKLDEQTLNEITEQGNGKYYRGSNTEDELEMIYDDLSQYEKTEYGTTRVTEYEDRFYYFLIPGLLILIFEFFVSANKSKLFLRFEDFQKQMTALNEK